MRRIEYMKIKVDNLTKAEINDLLKRRVIDKMLKRYSEMIDGE